MENNNSVFVFGVFDGLHEGHISFLKQAKAYGGKLIAVVARDKNVEALKRRMPRESELERLYMVSALPMVDKAILGDGKEGVYGVIKKLRPATICVGYDQDLLQKDLEEKMKRGTVPHTRIVRLAAYRPEAQFFVHT